MELLFEESIRNCYHRVLRTISQLVNGNKRGLRKLTGLRFSTSAENAVLEHVMTHLVKLESLSPGSAELFLQTIDEDLIVSSSLSRHNLKKLLSTYADESITELVLEALELAGLSGKVVLEKQQSDVDVVELVEGCFFPDVTTPLSLVNTAFTDAKVVPIDGYLESVQEINRILEEAASSKETVVLFVRGASDEVLHTLKVNYDRKTLAVLPVIVKYDFDGVNLLNDVAVASGSDVVSSLKGQLISSVSLSEFPRVDRVDLTSMGVLLESSSRSRELDRHVAFLQNKLLESNNEESRKAMEKRIHNLGSKRVTVRLRRGHDWTDRSFSVDRCLRAVKLAAAHGVTELNDRMYPLASARLASRYKREFASSVAELGALIS